MANIKELIQSIESGDSSFDEKLAAINKMEETLVAMKEHEQEAIDDNVELIIEALRTIEAKVEAKLRIIPEKGEQGIQGPKGEQGDRGLDGAQGKDGKSGVDGKDGLDGKDGVSVQDAKIDFDGSLVITLSDGREINVGEVVPVDVAQTIHKIQSGSGGDSQTVLDAIAALQATIATYGTMALQNKTSVDIEGGTIDNTTIGATTPSTGVFTTLTATGTSYLGGSSTSRGVQVDPVAGGTTTYTQFTKNVGINEQQIVAANTSNLGLIATGGGTINFYTASNNTQKQLVVAATSTAVNYVQVTGAATGSRPQLSAQGSDTNIGLNLYSKGNRSVSLYTNNALAFEALTPSSGVNYFTANGSITGQVPSFVSSGTDTNIAALIQSKGTGAIDLAAGSSGVNISNGGTVTAITTTANGSYTSAPSIAVSAPTTAGGVQSVIAVTTMTPTGIIAISSGGTGYTAGDVLTVSGGTLSSGTTQITVSTVSAGVITAATVSSFGVYSVLPSNPASVTGGTGSSATFTLNYRLFGALSITTAGSGYVEQPTVTFSGGGGSGAAAYATVGSASSIRSIGGTLRFFTPGGESLQIVDAGGTLANYFYFTGRSAGNPPQLVANGSDTNIDSAFVTKGTGNHRFFTNNAGPEQLRVTHTASAVNYVQVTGGATGSSVQISSQGSDSSVDLAYLTKSDGYHRFWCGSVGNEQFRIIRTLSAVNYFQATGGATGFGAVLSAQGSDANINAVVQPKGTGALQAQQTDSTATGGNARGANAVDWQTSRGAASQVASGASAFIGAGRQNTSSGQDSFLGAGFQNISSSSQSAVVNGARNVANGSSTFIGSGNDNIANLTYATVVGGQTNSATGYYGFVGNGTFNSTTSSSAVTTQATTTVTSGSTAITLSASNANIKVGQAVVGTGITFPNTYVSAISGTSLTISQNANATGTPTLSFYTPHGVVVGGGNNQATGSYSFIGGGGDAGTASNRNVASGDWSVVVGGFKNVGSGVLSGVLSGTNNTASGISAVVCGGGTYGSITQISGNTASGLSSFVGAGFGNTASSNASFVGAGKSNVSNGLYSFIGGGTDGTTRGIWGSHVIPALNPLNGVGTSQSATLVLGKQTTDATATVLTVDGGAAGTTNQVILPNNSAYYFKVEIIANVTGGGNTSGWELKGVIKRGANAASTAIVGSVTSTLIAQDAGASTWAVSATADTTNGGLKITCTGQASTTIRWVAKASTTEVTF